jgi:TRAP-type C4-dicarboxylate transport system substrate-binding protein
VPIPLSLIDVMQSLQTGMIEGVYGSPLSAIAMQWQTMVKYMLDMKIAYVPGGVLIKKNIWNKIPEKYRPVIMEESRKSFNKLTQLSRKENKEAMEALKKSGVTFTYINNEADIKLFEEISKKTADDLIGKFYTKEILEEVNKHLLEIRKNSTKGK